MKKLYLTFLLAAAAVHAQNGANITSWHLNTTGQKASYKSSPSTTVNMTDSAGMIKVCYDATYVYLSTDGLADNYVMGNWSIPNVPSAQNIIKRIPLTAQQQTGAKTAVPGGGHVAMAINGVPFYGNRSADSYKSSTTSNSGTGDGKWHCDAWYNEGPTMDASGGGHPTGGGAYHYHATPFTLYTEGATTHSPIVGFAYDGYPIYGPYGYSSAMNSSSTVERMASSYQLRNITTRTTYYDGTTTSPAGPNVSVTFPLGMYTEDYEYVNGLGDLDEYNGRFCVTPEYPAGTYAYFITIDEIGDPAFPYVLASYYYGIVPTGNITSIPSAGVTCITSVTSTVDQMEDAAVNVYPNPSADMITVQSNTQGDLKYTLSDLSGKEISKSSTQAGTGNISLKDLNGGVYLLILEDAQGKSKVLRIEKQ
jgi:hypothetical protein